MLQNKRLACSIDVTNLGVSESNMLAEVGNKALWHTFDVLNPKILVTMFDFVFSLLSLHKTKWLSDDQFCREKNLCAVFRLKI